MSIETLRAPTDGQEVRSNGFQVRVESLSKIKKRMASRVARHEAIHAVLAEVTGTSVRSVTIRPGPGYLGLTELSSFNAIAVAGPEADGSDGTDYDMSIIGAGASSAVSAAKSTIPENEDIIDEVACDLDEKGNMNGGEVRDAMRRRRNEEGEFLIHLITPDGREHTIFKKTIKKDDIEIPIDELPKAA